VLTRCKVFIDGELKGRIWSGEALAFDVSPGRHRVQIRMQLLRSTPLDVDLAEDQIVFVRCDLAPFAWSLPYYYYLVRREVVP